MHGVCNKCNELIPNGLARHQRLAHSKCSTCSWRGLKTAFAEHEPCASNLERPVHELASVREVLSALNISIHEFPFPIAPLDALPNGRVDETIYFGDGAGDKPLMFDGSLSDVVPVGLDLACGLMTMLKDDADVTVSVTVLLPTPARSNCQQGSFFCKDDEEPRSPTAEAARHFIMDITAGSEYRDTPIGWLNVSMEALVNRRELQSASMQHIREIYHGNDSDVRFQDCEANILPKCAPVNLHHDNTSGISIARAIQPRTSPHGKAVKLWLFWPFENVVYLPDHYSNPDGAVFGRMRHGMFMVQLDGETVSVPTGVPHCTFNLTASILIGSQFTFEDGFWLDRQLALFRSELAADLASADAGQPHLALSDALVQGVTGINPTRETIRSWLAHESELRAAFDNYPDQWQQMRAAWRPHVTSTDCPFCRELPANRYAQLTDEEHLSRHVPIIGDNQLLSQVEGRVNGSGDDVPRMQRVSVGKDYPDVGSGTSVQQE